MKLYQGRIPSDPNPLMDLINRSLPFDIRLLPQDVATNKAWAVELARLGVFSEKDLSEIHGALEEILSDFQAGAFDVLPDDEDVHTLVERLLTAKLGPVGARIHTGRSRNDQVVTDLRQYAVSVLRELERELLLLLDTLARRAEEHVETLMAGTTHMQPALPITLGQYLLSLAFALVRDLGRIRDAIKRTNLCPLGSGAMAGSGFAVDRSALARALGFDGVLPNTIDAVSDRDFCQEIAAALAALSTHLSRYAEDFVTWANPAFGYVRFSDHWSTGSSMMPQKRNPDAMELIRGKAARIIGAMTGLFCLTKGLPLTYAKDLQEDKEPLFDILDNTMLVVRVFSQAIGTAKFNPDRMRAALTSDMLATDLADALARTGVPFRKAHERVAAMVCELEETGETIADLDGGRLSLRFPEFGEHPPKLGFREGIEKRRVLGGTSPEQVRMQIAILRNLK